MKKFVQVLCAVLAAAFLLSGCSSAAKKDDAATENTWKPEGSVELIVPYAAGGGMDLMGRTIAEYIDLDGESMYVTNIEGGGGSIGSMEAYHADNDGLTLLLMSIQGPVAGYVVGTYPANLCSEMEWVACLADDPQIITVAADSPYETMEDVIAAEKENPGSLTMAAISGPATEASIKDLNAQAGTSIVYVPYDSGAKTRAAVLGGHEDLQYSQYADVKASVDAGELRVLAVASEEEEESIPDAPTLKELGIDVTYGSSRCVILPPETDEKIVQYYEEKLKEVFENEEFQTTMQENLGYITTFIAGEELSTKLDDMIEWAEEYVK